jgi:hypothetical protein
VEQEYGEPSSATSLAARTVLPGEPFDGPAASAVPGPRDVAPEQTPEAPQQWNFGPPAQSDFVSPPPAPRSFEPETYDPTYGAVVDPHHAPASVFTPTYATADSLAAPDQYESLHQFGELPIAAGYGDTALAPAYPAPPAYDLSKPPAYAAPEVPVAYPSPAGDLPAYPAESSWPAPPEAAYPSFAPPAHEHGLLAPPAPPIEAPPIGEDAQSAHRKSERRPNKALLALAAVVILGGGGYFGYTQLSKSDSSTATSTPITSAAPAASTPAATTPTAPAASAAYSYPTHLAGFAARTSSTAQALQRQITSFSKGAYPAYLGTPAVTSFGTANTASVVAVTFKPAASKLSAGFSTMLAGVQKPAAGNTVGAFASVPAGAAGGSMTCGSQTGASPITYCVWKGTSSVGMVYMKGRTDTPINQALTRELRAYAEH